MSRLTAAPVRRYAGAGLAALAVAAGLCACGGGGAKPAPTVTVTQPGSTSPSANPAASGPPAMVAVTTAGALVTLDPATGAVAKTLVANGVLGDEISASSSGQVYFAVQNGCTSKIEEIPASGGTATVLALGSLPAVSPDDTRLAYASQPVLSAACPLSSNNFLSLYHLEIRTLSGGATTSMSMVPASQYSGLPIPISHLSWATDSAHLAVSIAASQDNEGWGVYLLDAITAQYYAAGTGTALLPVTGQPSPQQSYLREGVYMPNGNLFVSRACCGGFPIQNTSRLMWEVNTSGVLVHQVALGFATLDHTSLDVSPDGNWLLYLAGNDLYVSHGGATPSKLTTGLIAAAWG